MDKRRQGPIKKKVDFLPNRLNKYSIRKFTVGTASILIGASLLFGAGEEAKAAENTDSTTENGGKLNLQNNVNNNDRNSDLTKEASTEEVAT
ncbi:YSIRK-type signal peptide-containing protein, partial [Staphylococcus sp. GDX8P54P]|uniref:YSIRK-type signal peptide-containing protein n=1 Tax=Staphylococcus sp. GDX8P54P TaxID=2804099 RepID=UPI001FDA34C5